MKPLPPGRLGLPWIGESLTIAFNNHGFYKERVAKYGPIFKTRLFGINFVVFSGPEGFHRFATDPAIERGGTDPLSVKQIFTTSLALIDGPEHRKRKHAMLMAVRDRDAIARYVPDMQKIMMKYISQWESRGVFTILPDLRRMAADFTVAMYTQDYSEEHVRELDKILGWMREAFMGVPVAIPGTTYGNAIRGRNRLHKIIYEAIERHRKGNYDDVVSRMIASAKEMGLPDDKLMGDLKHLIFAGQGGYFVPFLLITMTLAQHPELMERAREEALRVAPDGSITMDQLDRMEYLERLSRELRRFFAMNSATFFGKVKSEIEVGGYRIPAGWGAIGGVHITMANPAVFEDPKRFDPDRFLPERAAAMPDGAYVPHGGGERGGHRCPGEDIVAVAVKMYLALLLRQFRWELPPQDLTLTNEVFPLPTSGLKIQFHKHSPPPRQQMPRAAEGLAHR